MFKLIDNRTKNSRNVVEPIDIRLKRFPFPLIKHVKAISVNNQYIAVDYINAFETGETPGASIVEEYNMSPVVCVGSGAAVANYDLTFAGMTGAIGFLIDVNRVSTQEAVGQIKIVQSLGSVQTLKGSYEVTENGRIFHPLVEPLRAVDFPGASPTAGTPASVAVTNNPSETAFMLVNNRPTDHKLTIDLTNVNAKVFPIFKSIQLVTQLQEAFFSNNVPDFLLDYDRLIELY